MARTFPELPDGSLVPLPPDEVAPLDELDLAHFAGTDGTRGGGHKYGLGAENQTEFPRWVETLQHLQTIQDSVLTSEAVRIARGNYSRYLFRAPVTIENHMMVVHVAIEANGLPVTLYPINGDGVGKNVNGVRRDQPYNLDAWIKWAGGDD